MLWILDCKHYNDLGSEKSFHLLSVFDSVQILLNLFVVPLFFSTESFFE